MTKCLQFKAMERKNSSVLQRLRSAHKEQVKIKRNYLQVILECLISLPCKTLLLEAMKKVKMISWECQKKQETFLNYSLYNAKTFHGRSQNCRSSSSCMLSGHHPPSKMSYLAKVLDLVLEEITTSKEDWLLWNHHG